MIPKSHVNLMQQTLIKMFYSPLSIFVFMWALGLGGSLSLRMSSKEQGLWIFTFQP